MYQGSAADFLALQGFCANPEIPPQQPQKGDYTHLVDFLRLFIGFFSDKILYKNLKFFDKIFVPTFCRRRFRNALYGEKILSMGNVMFGHGFDKLV